MRDLLRQMKEVMDAMPPGRLASLIDAHKTFTRLKGFCEAKGYIEVMRKLSGIKVLKNTPEVKELKEVIDLLKPGGFKWEGLEVTEKSSKKSLDGS